MAHQSIDVGVSNGKTTVDSRVVSISIRKHDEVVWKTDQVQPFAVYFPGGRPFGSLIFVGTKDKPAWSRYAIKAKPDQDYKYFVKVLGAAELDPVIHTEP